MQKQLTRDHSVAMLQIEERMYNYNLLEDYLCLRLADHLSQKVDLSVNND